MKPFHPLNISCFTSHSLFSIIDVEAEEDKEPDEETQKGFETDEIEDEEDDEETPQKLNQRF